MKKIICLLGLVVMFMGCSGDKQDSQKQAEVESVAQGPIKLGLDNFPGWAHVFVAKEKGFFQKNGVEVELVYETDYIKGQQNFAQGKLDGIFGTYADAFKSGLCCGLFS